MASARTRIRHAGRRLPAPVKRRLGALLGSPTLRRVTHPIRWGNLRRVTPVSRRYGFDRGTPVDRVYLAEYFSAHAPDIRGRVLEVDRAQFTERYGAATSVDVLDVDGRNDRATILADLADAGALPRGEFDCIVLPQTLQYVGDLDVAVRNLWDALAPGGVLLVTVPAIAKIDHHAGDVDSWRLLPRGLERVLQRHCGDGEIAVTAYGNALTAAAFLVGAAAEELRSRDLERHDPDFPVLLGARVRKPVAS